MQINVYDYLKLFMGGGGGGLLWEWGDECSVDGGKAYGKDLCPNVRQPFRENIDRRSCNDGSRELIPVFHSSSQKYPLGVSS